MRSVCASVFMDTRGTDANQKDHKKVIIITGMRANRAPGFEVLLLNAHLRRHDIVLSVHYFARM